MAGGFLALVRLPPEKNDPTPLLQQVARTIVSIYSPTDKGEYKYISEKGRPEPGLLAGQILDECSGYPMPTDVSVCVSSYTRLIR